MLSAGYQRSLTTTTWKTSLSTCHIDHCWWSTLAENRDAWHLTFKHVVSFFESTSWATLKDKRCRRKNQCNQTLTRPSAEAAVTILVCPASALSAMNILAVSCSLFIKPSHDIKSHMKDCCKVLSPNKMGTGRIFYQLSFFHNYHTRRNNDCCHYWKPTADKK